MHAAGVLERAVRDTHPTHRGTLGTDFVPWCAAQGTAVQRWVMYELSS